jgi:hypothetical protein
MVAEHEVLTAGLIRNLEVQKQVEKVGALGNYNLALLSLAQVHVLEQTRIAALLPVLVLDRVPVEHRVLVQSPVRRP